MNMGRHNLSLLVIVLLILSITIRVSGGSSNPVPFVDSNGNVYVFVQSSYLISDYYDFRTQYVYVSDSSISSFVQYPEFDFGPFNMNNNTVVFNKGGNLNVNYFNISPSGISDPKEIISRATFESIFQLSSPDFFINDVNFSDQTSTIDIRWSESGNTEELCHFTEFYSNGTLKRDFTIPYSLFDSESYLKASGDNIEYIYSFDLSQRAILYSNNSIETDIPNLVNSTYEILRGNQVKNIFVPQIYKDDGNAGVGIIDLANDDPFLTMVDYEYINNVQVSEIRHCFALEEQSSNVIIGSMNTTGMKVFEVGNSPLQIHDMGYYPFPDWNSNHLTFFQEKSVNLRQIYRQGIEFYYPLASEIYRVNFANYTWDQPEQITDGGSYRISEGGFINLPTIPVLLGVLLIAIPIKARRIAHKRA